MKNLIMTMLLMAVTLLAMSCSTTITYDGGTDSPPDGDVLVDGDTDTPDGDIIEPDGDTESSDGDVVDGDQIDGDTESSDGDVVDGDSEATETDTEDEPSVIQRETMCVWMDNCGILLEGGDIRICPVKMFGDSTFECIRNIMGDTVCLDDHCTQEQCEDFQECQTTLDWQIQITGKSTKEVEDAWGNITEVPTEVDFSWDEAVEHCENLELNGHDDWRMPSLMELRTLVEAIYTDCSYVESLGWKACGPGVFDGKGHHVSCNCNQDAVFGECNWDMEIFGDDCLHDNGIPNTLGSNLFWSSDLYTYVSPTGLEMPMAWTIEFFDVNVSISRTDTYISRVRCVREEYVID